MGRMVTFRANGRAADGYLATPKGGHGPGLILCRNGGSRRPHQGFGRAVFPCRVPGLAPDPIRREDKSPDDAGKLMMALNIAEAAKDLNGAAEYLIALDGVAPKKVATVGFCMGGQLALFAACEFPGTIGAAVDFYGVHPAVNPDVANLSGPVLAHFATRDKSTPPNVANALVKQIQDARKQVEAYFYEADHAFMNDTRPEVYNPDAANLAWQRNVALFKKTNLQ